MGYGSHSDSLSEGFFFCLLDTDDADGDGTHDGAVGCDVFAALEPFVESGLGGIGEVVGMEDDASDGVWI
jgi:hypothetical protein